MKPNPMTRRLASSDQQPGTTADDVRRVALNLLAQREHSRLELHHKLSRRGYAPAVIAVVLEHLVAEDLLNEHRYAELYAHSRFDKGYGPVRIQLELRGRGVGGEIITAVLADLEEYWMPKLAELQRKRFGTVIPRDVAGRAQQIRFLRQRGFTSEQIDRLFRSS